MVLSLLQNCSTNTTIVRQRTPSCNDRLSRPSSSMRTVYAHELVNGVPDMKILYRSPINFNDTSFLEHWSKEGSGRRTTIDSIGSTRTL
ncbi:hypothetical protein ARMGADRAFT_109356 [Armillaria gallica]|uniref:Uncharacterized protein n=1 Tax=Armillaria gallica TaxID=47427 RepID=A0A2H3DIG0_ARMGA|nr:hypothetical protein ARMGADRAFT_109356 [Armillaria gallica]